MLADGVETVGFLRVCGRLALQPADGEIGIRVSRAVERDRRSVGGLQIRHASNLFSRARPRALLGMPSCRGRRSAAPLGEHGAFGLAQAVADASFAEGEDERADGHVVEVVEDCVGAGANLLAAFRGAELLDEVGKELCEAAVVPGAVASDLICALVDELAHAAFDVVADLAHLLEGLVGGVVDVPVFDASST